MDIPYVPADVNNHTVKIVVGKIPSIDYNKSIPFDPRKRKPQSKPILEDLNKLLF